MPQYKLIVESLVEGSKDTVIQGVITMVQVGLADNEETFHCTASKWGRPAAPLKTAYVKCNPRHPRWELFYFVTKELFQPDSEKEGEENAQQARAQKAAKESEGEGVKERAEGKKDAGK